MSRRSRPAKPPLIRAGIVAAAIEVLDADGLDGVTMRKLAQALDTATGSLYVYFANRDELLATVYDEVLGELSLPEQGDATSGWRSELTDVLLNALAVLGGHGGIARVALGAIPTGPHALALAEAILGLLMRGGVEDQAAAWAVDQLTLYVNAAALEESTYQQLRCGGAVGDHVSAHEICGTAPRAIPERVPAGRCTGHRQWRRARTLVHQHGAQRHAQRPNQPPDR